MQATDRLARPAASRGGHPRPIVSDRRPAQERRGQDVKRPVRAHGSVDVAPRPVTSEQSPMATLLATSAGAIGALPRAIPDRCSGVPAGRRMSLPHRRPRRSRREARRRTRRAQSGTPGRSARAARRDHRPRMTAVRTRPRGNGRSRQRSIDRAVCQVVASGQRVDVGVVTDARIRRAQQDRGHQLLCQHRLDRIAQHPHRCRVRSQ